MLEEGKEFFQDEPIRIPIGVNLSYAQYYKKMYHYQGHFW